MKILGTGVDLQHNSRFIKLVTADDENFFARVFTVQEREYCNQFKLVRARAERYSARFAAKEALVKALGTGFRKISFHEIEVEKDALGKPYFNVSGQVQELVKKKGIDDIHLSLSHSDDYSLAFVIVEGGREISCG